MSADPILPTDIALDPSVRFAPAPDPSAPDAPDASPARHGSSSRVLLTGATGFLGANLLADLLTRTPLHVRCLVRAVDAPDARARVRQSLDAQRLWQPAFDDRLDVVAGDLSLPSLGLSAAAFAALGDEMDAIYHAGARLNLFSPYRVLKPINVAGTHEMLRLAAIGRPKAFHHISSVVVFGARARHPSGELPEVFDVPDLASDASGYAASKWAAERLVTQAADRGATMSIYRPGRITGHSVTGIGNADDAFSLMLAGCLRCGIAPALDGVIHLTPVDIVSRAIVDLSRRADAGGQAYHLINPAAVTWLDVTDTLRARGYVRRIVSMDDWRAAIARERDARPDTLLERLHVLIARPRPPFSATRRDVSDARTRAGVGDLSYPADHAELIDRYARHLADAVVGRID